MENYKVKITGLSFGYAFDIIQTYPNVYGMRLPSWEKDVVIRVQVPDENSKMTAPYLYVESRFGRVPWKETMIEMFSHEWELVKFYEKDKTQPIEKESNNIIKEDNIESLLRDICNCIKDPSNIKKYHGITIDKNPKIEKIDKINKIKNTKLLTNEVKVKKDKNKTIDKKYIYSPECYSMSDKLMTDSIFVAYILSLL